MIEEWYRSCFDDTYVDLDRLCHREDASHKQVRNLASLLELHKSEQILDVCCGYGRYMLPLLSQGYSIAGIDLSKAMLTALQAEARKMNLSPEVTQCDMRRIPFTRRFHAAFMVGSSFGVFDNLEQDCAALNSIRNSLRMRGRLLIDQSNLILSRNKEINNTFTVRGEKVEERITWNANSDHYELRKKLYRGSWNRSWVMRFRFYDQISLGQILEQCNFTIEKFYGDFNGSPYMHASLA